MLEFVDSFDHYNQNWWSKWSITWNLYYDSSVKRNGAYSAKGGNNSSGKHYVGPQATRTVGFAFRLNGQLANGMIFALMDGGQYQLSLGVTNTGGFYVSRGNVTTIGSSAGGLFAYSQWNYVEFESTIHDVNGRFEVRLNGVNVCSATGVDTQQTTNAWSDVIHIGWGLGGPGVEINYDDFYCLNSTGTVNTTFLGDCKVEALTPNAEGAELQWTPSQGSIHWSLVDEVPPNNDTDYVYSGTPGQRDTFNFPDTSLIGAIKGVQVVLCARKDDENSRSIAAIARVGGTDYDSTPISIGDSYAMYKWIWENNPATGNPFTVAEFNAAEFGVRCAA